MNMGRMSPPSRFVGTAAQYGRAVREIERHITIEEDGTWKLNVGKAEDIGMDPGHFAHLSNRLDIFNDLIRRGEIDQKEMKIAPRNNNPGPTP